MYSFGCLLIIMQLFLFGNGTDEQRSLRLVQMLYRHGDRTPVEPFTNDIWKDSWPEGIGELTKLGKLQQYELGKYIRKLYNGFLNETYSPDEIYIRSTDKDRTLMSAYCNLAGLYPPQGYEIWNDDLLWQPIPVHTKPLSEDYELSADSVCAKYDKLLDEVMRRPEVIEFNQKHKEFFERLSNLTGWNVTSVFNVSDIYDALFVEEIHNKTLPSWADKETIQQMKDCQVHDWMWTFYTDELRKLRGGPLLGELIQNMQDKLNNKIKSLKAFVYSAHDMTIMALLSVLDLLEYVLPPYTAMVMIELHVDEMGNSSVKLFYRNSTVHDRYELHLAKCSSPCSFSNFQQLLQSRIPSDIRKECSSPEIPDNITLLSAVGGSILGCILLMLIVAAYAIHRKNSDKYRYVNIHNDNI